MKDWLNGSHGRIKTVHVGWALVGTLLFIIGTLIQSMPERYPELTSLLSQCEKAPNDCRAAVVSFDLNAHRASALSWPSVIGDLLRSVGASIVISIIIILTVESRSRREFDDLLTEKARELGMNVFHGMFNRDHPVALLNAVKEQVLERALIRDNLDVTYTFSLIENGTGDAAEKFIKVDVLLASTTRNVSTLSGDAGRAKMPLALLLPNPQVQALKNTVGVVHFIVNGVARSAAELAAANEGLQAALADDSNNDARADFGEIELEPGESVSLLASYTMIKELEDTEVFRTLQICRGLSLTVIDKSGLDLHIQAKAIHPRPMESIGASDSSLQWRIADIILPQQGIMVFWKRKRPFVLVAPTA